MGKNRFQLIDIVCYIFAGLLSSVYKINEYEVLFKKKINRAVVYWAMNFILLLSIWLSALILGVFWLLSLSFSAIQISLLIIVLNLFLLLCSWLWFISKKQQLVAVSDSSLVMLLGVIVKVIEAYKKSVKE